MASTLTSAYRAERATSQNGQGKARRDPIATVIGRWAGRHLPRWTTVRTAAYTWTAGAAVTWAAADTDPRLGALVGAAALLGIEYLGRTDQ